MADGKVVGLNYMDNELYCIGPGPSGTTVSAPQTISALGSSVMITGTVTDQTTTGRRNDNYNFDFTLQGTPAISDASMGRWMEYLYENQAKPTNATGVPVTLTAIDPNGNIINVGTTTSDINGNYGVVFKPDVPGTYQILASFAGSKAYGPSQDSTYLAVGVGPTTTPARPSHHVGRRNRSCASPWFSKSGRWPRLPRCRHSVWRAAGPERRRGGGFATERLACPRA